MSEFMFATGIENSYPTIEWKGKTIRQDELAKTKHYERWRDDFRLAAGTGDSNISGTARRISRRIPVPDKYDWSFTDETFRALHEQKVTPIVDLCHFGVPDWIGNFQNPDWPKLFVEYAQAFARRFPWVRFYTPVNEIFIAATFSAQFGWWNERLKTDRAFVNALKHLCQANVMAMHAILKERPDAIFIQSESTQYFHPEGPDCEDAARRFNEKRFLSFDLTYGHHLNATIYEYLLDNGMTRDEYHWFLQHHVRSRCVMGNDYYETNENLVHADGSYLAFRRDLWLLPDHSSVLRPVLAARDAHRDERLGWRGRSQVAEKGMGECTSPQTGRRAYCGVHLVQSPGSGGLGHGTARG